MGQVAMLKNLSFSPNSVSKLISNPNWVHALAIEYERVTKKINTSEYPDKDLFEERIINSGGINYLEHRESVRRWMELAWHKGRSLFTILDQIPTALKLETAAQSEYGAISLGPIDSDMAKTLDDKQRSRIRDANIIRGYSRCAILNTCGYYISELFFSFEAMCRVICMGSCLELFYKTILPNITVQHKDLFDALNLLSRDSHEKLSCRMCLANEVCYSLEIFRHLRDFYLLIYHLRIVRDYKTEFYYSNELATKLLDTFVPLGFDVICKTEKLMSQSIGNRMISPLSLSQEKNHINRIKEELLRNAVSS